jgi:dihydroflavonol-4-reductase
MQPVVLVTGATGLVGNNVVRQLLQAGRRVRVLVRGQRDDRPFAGLEVEFASGDICDAASVAAACAGVNAVIHSAGYVQMGWSRLDLFRAVNVEGTRNVARAAREAGARLVHVSSCDALGVRSLEHPADEETPFKAAAPVPYAVTKYEAEQVILAGLDAGLDAVIVNPGFMLGPWDWKPSSGRMLLAVAKGQGLFPPRGWFSVGDVRDVAAGTIAALERGQTGRRYILTAETMSYAEAFRLFANVTGGRAPIFRPGPLILFAAGKLGDWWGKLSGHEPDVNSAALKLAKLPKAYSNQRARDELGYTTRPFKESVIDSWNWFREHGYAK